MIDLLQTTAKLRPSFWIDALRHKFRNALSPVTSPQHGADTSFGSSTATHSPTHDAQPASEPVVSSPLRSAVLSVSQRHNSTASPSRAKLETPVRKSALGKRTESIGDVIEEGSVLLFSTPGAPTPQHDKSCIENFVTPYPYPREHETSENDHEDAGRSQAEVVGTARQGLRF
jgi:hypothetical protein